MWVNGHSEAVEEIAEGKTIAVYIRIAKVREAGSSGLRT